MRADGFVADLADPIGAAARVLGGKADIVFECVAVPGPRLLVIGAITLDVTLESFEALKLRTRRCKVLIAP